MLEFGAHIEPEAEARGSERSTRVMSYLYFPYQGVAALCRDTGVDTVLVRTAKAVGETRDR
jgi:hypothetical protein